MEGSHIEGLAIHGGPEPCVGDPQGRSEALARGARRPAMEPRNVHIWGADAVLSGGRQHCWRRFREPFSRPHEVGEPVHACDLSMLENRESPRSPELADDTPPFMDRGVAYRLAAGRAGKAKAVIP
jgi:hypothetical protein